MKPKKKPAKKPAKKPVKPPVKKPPVKKPPVKKPPVKMTKGSGWPAAGVITITGPQAVAVDPPSIRLTHDSDLSFLVVNQDIDAHDVWLDPSKVIVKDTGRPEAPWSITAPKTRVPAGGTRILIYRMNPQFDPPSVTLKYTVDLFTPGQPVHSLDPDLDVSDPRGLSASG
jgi:hypothetical protein